MPKLSVHHVLLLWGLIPVLPAVDSVCTDQYWCFDFYNNVTNKFHRTWWNLTEVPPDIPAEAVRVDLHRNLITHILVDSMIRNLSACTHLILSNNKISFIQEGSLMHLTSLTQLKLEGNLLKTLKYGMFAALFDLEILDLSRNIISTIQPGTFIDCLSLMRLYLQRNALTTIAPDKFRGLSYLTTLDIARNNITFVENRTFDHLYSVKRLEVQENNFNTWNPDLYVNLPRPLFLSLSRLEPNSKNCSSVCWYRHELHHGTLSFSSLAPTCFSKARWFSACGDSGEYVDTTCLFLEQTRKQ